jgi:hypothetical protein
VCSPGTSCALGWTTFAKWRGHCDGDPRIRAPGRIFNLARVAHVTIQGFVIQHACDSGIQSNDSAHDITLRWNELRYIANHTITDQYGRDGIFINGMEYNFTFDGNVFHDIGRTDGVSNLHFDHGIYACGVSRPQGAKYDVGAYER